MKTRMVTVLLALCTALPCSLGGKQKEKEPVKPVAPIGWLDLHGGSRKLSVSEEDFQRVTRKLAQGSLVPVFKTKEKHGATLARVGALNLETGNAELGWVEIKSTEIMPAESSPQDSELLRLLGPPYVDDFTAHHTDIARFLVRASPDLRHCCAMCLRRHFRWPSS